ncbi:biotin transporter BioY [Brevundimonas lenta]|uniref:Biotin transporter n=1 Tax=Brevundimonas lenta TaxID=424796 RepID=A0A7W6JAU3_9CAUL|nr:biotin transporter BioY [Brevundimonas lenta]MBB4081730.1 biotin transport system substrate-specific component [Brevundimonas lenta]
MRLLRSALLILAFAALMVLAARLTVPMVPVPMTMQTFAVLLAGAVLGARRGILAVLLYLALAAVGLPVLSDGASGLARFAGPTAGYLFAFPVAAGLVGALFERVGGLVAKLALLIGAHLLILTAGAAWLAVGIGLRPALDAGFTPFLIGAVVKSVLVVACAEGIRRAPLKL